MPSPFIPNVIMKQILSLLILFLCFGVVYAEDKPFVTYPEAIDAYLKRVQQGKQTHAFDETANFAKWQKQARSALVKLTGLRQMEKELAGFEPKVEMGKEDASQKEFTRALCSIETEPGVKVPFYLLVPKSDSPGQRFPLLLCPHGHDSLGLHSYAGAYKDEKHKAKVLSKEGNVAEQAVMRDFIAIAPATRGLAKEVSMPDPKGRHGNRPCRAQLMHCLVAGRTPTAERVWDMQRILDWAVKRPLVDKSQIVMTGNSGGGVLTAYTAAIDERIQLAVPSCSFTSVIDASGFIFHCDCCMVPGLRNWGDWAELGGLVAPRHLLLVHGVDDSLHHRPTVEKVYGEIKKIFEKVDAEKNVSLKWGNQGHRFYPSLMWPFIEEGLKSATK